MIRVVVDDLAFLGADAVVRPATTRLAPTTPAVRRLESVAGPGFADSLRLQKELAVGAAVVTAGGGGLPALDTSRLRATWLADCAQLLGLPAFMAAAGITCSQRLGDIIAGLDPGGEEQAVALLGGHR